MRDAFTAAYLSGAAVLITAEFVAIFRKRSGDTITEKTKSTRITHMAMSSLLGWGLWHFVGSDVTGYDSLAANIAVATAGGVAGAVAHSRR